MQDFTVYIENRVDRESPYFVSTDAVERALGPLASVARVSCNSHLTHNFRTLEQARYFIGSGFHPWMLSRHGKQIRIAHCTSAGVEKYLLLDWIPPGAVLTNSSGVHAEKGGAFGAMTAIMLLEGVPRHIRNQRLHRWDNRLSTGIARKTVVILGLGSLGQAIESRLKPFNVKIVGVTAASIRNATGGMTPEFAVAAGIASNGGVTIRFDGKLAGAIGVGSGTGDQDIEADQV